MACARSESIFCCPRAFADFFRELDRFPEALWLPLEDLPLDKLAVFDEVLCFLLLLVALALAAGLADVSAVESCCRAAARLAQARRTTQTAHRRAFRIVPKAF